MGSCMRVDGVRVGWGFATGAVHPLSLRPFSELPSIEECSSTTGKVGGMSFRCFVENPILLLEVLMKCDD